MAATFKASEEDMKKYAELVQRVAALNTQREILLQMISEWEKEHMEEDNNDGN